MTIISALIFCVSTFLKDDSGIVIKFPYFSQDSYFYFPCIHCLQYFLTFTGAFNLTNSDLSLVYLALGILGAVKITREIIDLHQNNIQANPSVLTILLKRHCDIITNMDVLQDILFWISFSHFISTTIILLVSFSCARTKTESQFAISVICLVLGELFVLCLFGQIIQTKMQKLSDQLYLTNWYDLGQKDQKRFLHHPKNN